MRDKPEMVDRCGTKFFQVYGRDRVREEEAERETGPIEPEVRGPECMEVEQAQGMIGNIIQKILFNVIFSNLKITFP